MICSPFEDCNISKDYGSDFDLVFTSPPYFNTEHYSDEETQSTIKYKQGEDWYTNFLLYSLKKAWECLAVGGHMVIVLNDSPDSDQKICARMIQDVNLFIDSIYLGVISYAERSTKQRTKQRKFGKSVKESDWKSPQPMWIWEKTEKITTETEIILQPLKDLKNENDEFSENDDENNIFIVRDDVLPGGTMSRGSDIIKDVSEKEIVYFGENGEDYLASAMGVMGKIYGKRSTFFTKTSGGAPKEMIFKARMLGVNILFKYFDRRGFTEENDRRGFTEENDRRGFTEENDRRGFTEENYCASLKEVANRYCENNKGKGGTTDSHLVPFHSDKFKKFLFMNIVKYWPENVAIENMWCTGDEFCTLLDVLYKIHHRCYFYVVDVTTFHSVYSSYSVHNSYSVCCDDSKEDLLWRLQEKVDQKNSKLVLSTTLVLDKDRNFGQQRGDVLKSPYPSIESRDEKLWYNFTRKQRRGKHILWNSFSESLL